jgi:hypothetical protein
VYGTLVVIPVLFWLVRITPDVVAAAQFSVAVPITDTVTSRLQLCPPMLSAKLAVPSLEGVPVMEQVNVPDPTEKPPALSVAVRPVTPVEVTVCPL